MYKFLYEYSIVIEYLKICNASAVPLSFDERMYAVTYFHPTCQRTGPLAFARRSP